MSIKHTTTITPLGLQQDFGQRMAWKIRTFNHAYGEHDTWYLTFCGNSGFTLYEDFFEDPECHKIGLRLKSNKLIQINSWDKPLKASPDEAIEVAETIALSLGIGDTFSDLPNSVLAGLPYEDEEFVDDVPTEWETSFRP